MYMNATVAEMWYLSLKVALSPTALSRTQQQQGIKYYLFPLLIEKRTIPQYSTVHRTFVRWSTPGR